MGKINDPLKLKGYLEHFGAVGLTPAESQLLLAAKGIRAGIKGLQQAVRISGRVVNPEPTRCFDSSRTTRKQLTPIDSLPLTPEERAIMERLRRSRRGNGMEGP